MRKIVLSLIALTVFGFGANAQNWNEMIKAVASDRGTEDSFGYNVAIDGDRAVVGATLEDDDALGGATETDAGSAYVFELSNGVWTETAKLVASDRSTDDRFGCRVGISGDRIIIGAFFDKEDVSGSATLNEAGSAYIFEFDGNGWTETAKLVASDRGAGYRFGHDVDISGEKAIVGSYYNATDVSGGVAYTSAGAAYIFELNNGVWAETEKLVASDRTVYNYFGHSVSIDGETAVIGAHGNKTDTTAGGGSSYTNAGAAYIFESIGGAWTQTIKLVASDRGTNDVFGFDVAINNNRVVVGAYKDGEDATGGNALTEAGSAYIFEPINGVWTETTKLVASDRDANNQFGYAIDVSADNIIIGSRFESTDALGGNTLTESGAAYIFNYSGGVWTETAKLVASDRGANDNLGTSVGISGNMAITAAPLEDEDVAGVNTLADAGAVYIFNTCNANPGVTISDQTLIATTTGAAYQWLDCDNGNAIIPNETNQSFTATVNGNYAVSVTLGGCTDISACASISTLGINELNNNTSIYPNPASTQLSVHATEQIEAITLLDITGKVVKTITSPINTIDVSDLTEGVYFLQIETDNAVVSKRFIKL